MQLKTLRVASSICIGTACTGGIVFGLIRGSYIGGLEVGSNSELDLGSIEQINDDVVEVLSDKGIKVLDPSLDEVGVVIEKDDAEVPDTTTTPKEAVKEVIEDQQNEEDQTEDISDVFVEEDTLTYDDWTTKRGSKNTQGAFMYKNEYDVEAYKKYLKDVDAGNCGSTGMFPGVDGYLGNEQYQVLYDYTVKITRDDHLHRPSHIGTGIILDFELPTGNEKYPRTWYLATTMETLKLVDRVGNNLDVNYEYDEYPSTHHKHVYISRSPLLQTDPKKPLELNNYDYDHINAPRVTFVATNFLKDKPKRTYTHTDKGTNATKEYTNENYHVNFGVLKVRFTTEVYAQKMTGNWFGKYISQDENGNYIKKPGSKHIDFGAEPITKHRSKYLKERLQLFTGAYPSNVKFSKKTGAQTWWDLHRRNIFVINQLLEQDEKAKDWDRSKAKSTMTDEEWKGVNWNKGTSLGMLDTENYQYHLKNDFDETLVGLIDANSFRQSIGKNTSGEDVSQANSIKWKDTVYYPWNITYLAGNLGITRGTSGAMVIDQNLNFIGLHFLQMKGKDERAHVVVPLKSEEIWEGDYQVAPKYDLIFGDERTHSKSHRVFVNKHKKNTWMRQYYGWDKDYEGIKAKEAQELKSRREKLSTTDDLSKKLKDGKHQMALFPVNIVGQKPQEVLSSVAA